MSSSTSGNTTLSTESFIRRTHTHCSAALPLTRGGAAVALAGLHQSEGDPLATLLPVAGRITLACRGGGRAQLREREGGGGERGERGRKKEERGREGGEGREGGGGGGGGGERGERGRKKEERGREGGERGVIQTRKEEERV